MGVLGSELKGMREKKELFLALGQRLIFLLLWQRSTLFPCDNLDNDVQGGARGIQHQRAFVKGAFFLDVPQASI